MDNLPESSELFLDGNRGMYIPKHFAEIVIREKFFRVGFSGDEYQWPDYDFNTLLDGPDNESYWYVWEDMLDNGVLIDSNGIRWALYQDGDLWVIKESDMRHAD